MMTVKELLLQLRPTLITHEWNTLWSKGHPCELRIDIEHNHHFHAVGKFDRSFDPFKNTDYYILQPFTCSFYNGTRYGEKFETCVLDMEVYRWKLAQDSENKSLWELFIETHQD